MKATEFFRKVQFPLMLAIGTYSAGACISAYFAPSLLQNVWLFPGVYFLFAVIGLLLPGKLRVPLSIVGAAALLVPVVLYLEGNARMLGLVLAVAYSALMLWSMSFGGWEREKEIPGPWIGVGIVILLTGSFFATFEPKLQYLLPWSKAMVFAFALLAMLSMNRRSRTLASGGRQSYTASMRRKNVMLTLAMFAIALGIALIPSLFDLLETIWEWIKELLAKIAAMIPEETEPSTTPPTTESFTKGEGGMPDIPYRRNHSALLYTTITIVAVSTMIFLVVVSARKLIRLLREMVRKIYEKVTDGVTADAQDFVDEITDTRADGQSAYSRKPKDPRTPAPDVRRMTPVQRVRYRYRMLIKKHPYWSKHSTARENLPKDAAQIYEKARYSEHGVTDEDAQRFAEETRPEKEPW